MEQLKPYLVWICLSVHNRSHSMEQPSLRKVGSDGRSLRKAVGLIFFARVKLCGDIRGFFETVGLETVLRFG